MNNDAWKLNTQREEGDDELEFEVEWIESGRKELKNYLDRFAEQFNYSSICVSRATVDL